MSKPMTIARAEMLQRIYAAINEAELPAFVVADALERLTAEARAAADEQFARDMAEFQEEEEEE